MDTTPTFEEVKESLAGRILALAHFVEDILEVPATNVLGVTADSSILEASKLDIDPYPVARGLRALYDYGFHAELGREASEGHDHLRNRELLADFAEVVNDNSALFEEILGGIHWTSTREDPARLLDQLIELVEARACLDGGTELTVQQVAVLADMSERSVRNALSLEGPAGLRSKRVDSGDGDKQTLIENQEAKRWLVGRRGFRQTKRSWVAEESLSELPQPSSLREFNGLLRQRIDWLHGNAQAAAAASDVSEEFVRDAMNNSLPISDENVEKLARVLKVPADWLAEQWLRTALTRHQHLLRDRISK